MQVILQVYSGRPSPAWDLAPSEAAELRDRLAALPPTATDAPVGGLGYQGFKVNSGVATGFDELTVFGGVVVESASGTTRNLADPGEALERWLLETGRDHIDQALYDDITHR
jgi:hypothetical protein